MSKLVGFFDGAYLWEDGHAAYGCVVKRDREVIYTDHGYLGASRARLSVNCAEYAGLISILKFLISIDADEAEIFGDSKLVVYQMARKWKAKDGIYLSHYVEAAQLRNKLPRVTFRWIPREQNGEADALSKIPLQSFYGDYKYNHMDAEFARAIEAED